MKLGFNLRASISPLLTGTKRSISESILFNPNHSFYNGSVFSKGFHAGFKCVNASLERTISNSGLLQKFRSQTSSDLSLTVSRYQATGLQNWKHSLHSSSGEEDEFSELGKPLPKVGRTRLDLVTERRKVSLNADASIRAVVGKQGKDNSRRKTTSLERNKFNLAFRSILENNIGDSRGTKDADHVLEAEGPNSITIEKVPDTVSLAQLKEAISVFGQISDASMNAGSDGFNSCHVKFRTEESKERALATRGIFVQSFHLPISNLHVRENITIRIKNISVDTAESAIHSICKGCGSFNGLSKLKEGTVDVFFSVNSSSARESILKKLNEMSLDNCRWSAEILQESTGSTVVPNIASVQLGAGLELSKCLEEIQAQLNTNKILLDDLYCLQQEVLHLQDRPAAPTW